MLSLQPGPKTTAFPLLCFQELEKLGLGDSVDLHVYEIPVEYQTVQRLIPALWEKHSPQVSGAEVSGVKAGASLAGSAAGGPRHGWFVRLCSCSDHMVDASLIPPSATLFWVTLGGERGKQTSETLQRLILSH